MCKVLQKAKMSNGDIIQIEDWSGVYKKGEVLTFGHFRTGKYTNVIRVNTIAKKTDFHSWVKKGENIQIFIVSHPYDNFTNDDIQKAFTDLQHGKKSIKDYRHHLLDNRDIVYI